MQAVWVFRLISILFASTFINSHTFSENCPEGTYRNSDMTSCTQCEINTISTAGATSCTDCPAGTEANEDRTECGEYRVYT